MEIFAASRMLTMTGAPEKSNALLVSEGRVVGTGTLAELRSQHTATIHEFPGCVIMPGLVNAHTHLELTHFPAWKIRKGIDYSPRTYVDWVVQVIKIKRALTQQELELSLREGFRISLEAGTTAVGDIMSDRRLLPHYETAPFFGRLFFEALGQDPVQNLQQLRGLEEAIAFRFSNSISPGISPHAPHTVAPDYLRDLKLFAARHSLPVMIHVAESREESAFLHDTSGRIAEELYPLVHWEAYLPRPRHTTPVRFLDDIGVLDKDTVAVHCVHVSAADAELLRERCVPVVLCPRSNDRLVVGTAPVRNFKKTGILLALGTDSLASNDSLSLWDEMRFLRSQHPGLFTPRELLEMVTCNAAEILHLGEAGSLDVGKRADFIVVRPKTLPDGDEVMDAVIEESGIEEVFIAGRHVTI
ncbi:amidohydrolase family protein [Geobacter sp. DSM 9736]|uniref:amidohydrolase family protein n=1 Tax=Geobacter sp. DSM 9736 TaxID=1277350 RepID=UPI000B506EE0|nr:amidohydrolase family protein [Geobacter sp. DSM 9736]SNB45954.1 Cytosine/adenosine deaminase [Geobacter sp. DSM 9736]